ncbi:MAG: hypothetical protein AB7K68_10395 [Bacteriovoracia bacterium]
MMKLILVLGIFGALHAQAGVINGGGGKGILCVNPDGSRTVESLDRYEARIVWRYSVPESKDFDAEFLRMMSRAHYAFNGNAHQAPGPYSAKEHEEFLLLLKVFQAQMNFLPVGTHLKPTDDAGEVVIPPANCAITQVIHYLDETERTGQILVDKEYWDLLSPQDQVGFFMHEVVYKDFRTSGETSSLRTRKLVGRLLSSEVYPNPYSPLWGAPKMLHCLGKMDDYGWGTSSGLDFYVVPAVDKPGRNAALLVFTTIGDDGMMAATTALSPFEYESFTGDPQYASYGSASLSVNSFYGPRSLVLRMGGEGAGSPPPQPSLRKMFMRFDRKGQTQETEFSCQPEERQ